MKFRELLYCTFSICCFFVLSTGQQKQQLNSFSVVRKVEGSNQYVVERKNSPPSHRGTIDPQRFEKELNLHKKIDAQREQAQKIYLAEKKAQQQYAQQNQVVKQPILKKITLLGKETRFYEGPHLPQSYQSPSLSKTLVSNVLINGKQVDTIFAGAPFTLSFSFAPNAISAVVNIYADINGNGLIDSSDIPVILNGLVIDNEEDDLDPSIGGCSLNFQGQYLYSGIISTLIFEVNDFQSVFSAKLTIQQKKNTRVIAGTIKPVFKNTYVELYSYSQNWEWLRLVFPDTSGAFSVSVDSSIIKNIYVYVGNLDKTPVGYIPPQATNIQITKDTTRLSLSYTTAKEFIEGYVKDQNGNPVKNAGINAYHYESNSGSINSRTVTDSSGYYILGAVYGSWDLNISTPATTDEYLIKGNLYRTVSVGNNQTVREDFMLVKSNSTISGSIKYNGNGVGGLSVSGNNDSLSNNCFTGVNGAYTLKVYKPVSGTSNYYISPNASYNSGYYIDPSFQSYILPGATNVNFIMKKISGGVQGKVTDSRTGLPIKNASGYFYGQSSRYFSTDDSGYYKVRLQDGSYTISANAQFYESYNENNPIIISGSVITKNISLVRIGSFTGTVKDELGNPIYDAYIVGYDSLGYWSNSYYSDRSGEYGVTITQSSSYKARASANGFIAQWYDKKPTMDSANSFTVTKGFDTPNINFVLSRGGSLSGIVKDKYGNSLPNIFVTVMDTFYYSVSGSQTDDSGKYVVTGLPTGKYYVVAHRDDYLEQWYNGVSNYLQATKISITINQNTPNINFTLSTGASITGKVTDKQGNPIPDAEITVTDTMYSYMRYAYTDGSGIYTIKRITPGQKLYAQAHAYGFSEWWYNNVSSSDSATGIILIGEEIRENINFTLPMAGKITGSVKTKAGTPIQSASIYATQITNGYGYYYGSSDQYGNYTIENMNSGKYFVYAYNYEYSQQYYDHKTSWELADTVIVVEEKTTANINFNLAKGGSISGIVKNVAGEPVPNVSLYANKINGNNYYGSSDYLGNYTITNMASGKYSVSSYHSDYNEQWYNHRSSMLLADSVLVAEETTTSNINFDLKPFTTDSIVIKIIVDNLPDSLTFNQSYVPDNYWEYAWGIRFKDLPNDSATAEIEITMVHWKPSGSIQYTADPISGTEHVIIHWIGNYGNVVYTNVRAWRDPIQKNTLYLAAPTSWWEIQNLGPNAKFYGKSYYHGTNGAVIDQTTVGVGETTVTDAKGDVSYPFIDVLSVGVKKITPLSVDQVMEIPITFALTQNYPNPFNPTTTIKYALPSSHRVKLSIYNVLGQKVIDLVNEEQSAGWKEVQWNAATVASGIYFYKITAGSFVETKKMLMVK